MYTLFIYVPQQVYGTDRDLLDCASHYLSSLPLTFILMFTMLWGPITITAIIYVAIYKIAHKAGKINLKPKKKKKGKGNQTTGEAACTGESVSVAQQKTQTDSAKDDAKDKKAIRTIALLLVVFTMCWLPISFGFITTAYEANVNGYFLVTCYWLGYLNSTLNPVCYAIGNPNFRETLFRVFCGIHPKKKVYAPSSTNTSTTVSSI